MKCIFSKNFNLPEKLPHNENINELLSFPEKSITLPEQQAFSVNNHSEKYVITSSPFIVSCFQSDQSIRQYKLIIKIRNLL